jgi:hypothetical protein
MKNIAICMSGHMRLYKKHLDSLKPLLAKYNCHIFICTWDTMDFNYLPHEQFYHIPYPKGCDHLTKTNKKQVKQDYLDAGAKSVVLEIVERGCDNQYWYEKFKHWCYAKENVSHRIAQWSLISSSWKLFEANKISNVAYDYCIWTRPDVIYKISDIAKHLWKDCIILCGKNDTFHIVSDIFFMGAEVYMKQICSVFESFNQVYELTKDNERLLENCHRLHKWYCEHRGIPYEIVQEHCAEIVKTDKFIY